MDSELVARLQEERNSDFEWALRYVKSKQWRNAKTYENTTPHEYIVCHRGDYGREDFKKMFSLIERYGVREKFFGKDWTYFYLGDGYKYFAADGGYWEEDRFILNRAKEENSYE